MYECAVPGIFVEIDNSESIRLVLAAKPEVA